MLSVHDPRSPVRSQEHAAGICSPPVSCSILKGEGDLLPVSGSREHKGNPPVRRRDLIRIKGSLFFPSYKDRECPHGHVVRDGDHDLTALFLVELSILYPRDHSIRRCSVYSKSDGHAFELVVLPVAGLIDGTHKDLVFPLFCKQLLIQEIPVSFPVIFPGDILDPIALLRQRKYPAVMVEGDPVIMESVDIHFKDLDAAALPMVVFPKVVRRRVGKIVIGPEAVDREFQLSFRFVPGKVRYRRRERIYIILCDHMRYIGKHHPSSMLQKA